MFTSVQLLNFEWVIYFLFCNVTSAREWDFTAQIVWWYSAYAQLGGNNNSALHILDFCCCQNSSIKLKTDLCRSLRKNISELHSKLCTKKLELQNTQLVQNAKALDNAKGLVKITQFFTGVWLRKISHTFFWKSIFVQFVRSSGHCLISSPQRLAVVCALQC